MAKPGHLGFSTYLRLVLRNLWRNPRRTTITLASLVVGIAALTFLGALNDGWLEEMKANFILTLNGHLQVHARGFEDSRRVQEHIPDPDVITQVLDQDPDVMGWSLRLRSAGLAARAGASAGIQLMAVDPEMETWVTRMRECVDDGRWLHPEVPQALLLGSTLAENLGARIGDKVVITAQGPDGQMASDVFYLRGTLCGGAPQVDRTLAVVSLETAQGWLAMGEGVTDVVVRATSADAVNGIRDRLSAALPPGQYEVLRWQDLDPMVRQWLRFSDAYSLVVIFVVMALVVAEVLNTMLMALHERTRELGLMEALGTRSRQLFAMMLMESVLLVMLGAVLGYLLGLAAVIGLQDTGVDLSRFSNAFKFFYMSPVIRPVLTPGTGIQIIGTTLVASLVAGLYPAWRSARLDPIAALRRI